jgi:hypothetical protein
MRTTETNNIVWAENFGEKSAGIINLIINNFLHEELISFLRSDDAEIKSVALLKLSKITTTQEASLVCSCLVNHPTETREYASFLVTKCFKNPELRLFFDAAKNIEIFFKTMFDVNPKICRNTLEILEFFDEKDKENLVEMYIDSINNLFIKIGESSGPKDRLHDKLLFNLYWNLYALGILLFRLSENEKYINETLKIIKNTINFKEYTIRERGACLLNSLGILQNYEEIIRNFTSNFLNDENFYVKNAISKTIKP